MIYKITWKSWYLTIDDKACALLSDSQQAQCVCLTSAVNSSSGQFHMHIEVMKGESCKS